MVLGKCRAVVTGGLGFIGSNLALRLLEEGAEVTIVDSVEPGCGANYANLDDRLPFLHVIESNIGDPAGWTRILERADVIFNLAGEVSHIQSARAPERDLRLNAISQLHFLRALARVRPGVRVVYAGTRQVCGRPQYLPVDEEHPTEPVDFNGIHKLAAEQYHRLMARDGLLDSVVLRLTNVYGPRMGLHVRGQGFLPAFLARVLAGQPLEVFGDGLQLRDPVYVDDVVEAFLLAASVERPPSRLYHIGGPCAMNLLMIASTMHGRGGIRAPVRLRPFPEEQAAFDIGDYQADWSRIERELGWRPKVIFRDGIDASLKYFMAREAVSRPALTGVVG